MMKAGFLPYYLRNNVPVFLFMVSSDANFGGDEPMIAKGHIDEGESIEAAALREAEEELGLKQDNLKRNTIFRVCSQWTTGLTDTYLMHVYAGEVKDLKDFKSPHYETDSTHWMTLEEYELRGKFSQRLIVRAAHNAILD